VLITVTITLSKVVVEQPQPRVLVRNSKRSWLDGQMSALKTGSRRLVAGTQIPLYIIWSAKIRGERRQWRCFACTTAIAPHGR
jgi:hypothetical protein